MIEARLERLRAEHQDKAKDTAVYALEDPWVYDLAKLNAPQRKALVKFWDAWLAELQTVRLLDPACGSGAFLIEAFDQFHRHYQEINDRLTSCGAASRASSTPTARSCSTTCTASTSTARRSRSRASASGSRPPSAARS